MAFDRAGAKAAGWTDQQIDAYLSARQQGKPKNVAEQIATTASALSNQSIRPTQDDQRVINHDAARAFRALFTDNLPMIAATGATLPLGGVGGWGGVLARVMASGAAGGGSALAQDALRGQPLDMQRAAWEGGVNALTQGVGEGVSAGLNSRALPLMKRAIGKQDQLTKEAMLAAGANPRFEPPDRDLIAKQMLDERVPVGRLNPKGKYGSAKLNEQIAAARASKVQALRDAGQRGISYTAQDATSRMQELRDALGFSEAPATERKLMEKRLARFLQERRVTTPQGKPGKFIRYSPEDFDRLRKEMDTIAEGLYTAGKPPVEPTSRRAEQFSARVAGGIRDKISADIPEVGTYNDRMRKLIPMRDATLVAESRPMMNRTQIALGTGSGLLTGSAAHLPPEQVALAGASGFALQQALNNPAVSSRLALLFSDPAFVQAIRYSPRLAQPLFNQQQP